MSPVKEALELAIQVIASNRDRFVDIEEDTRYLDNRKDPRVMGIATVAKQGELSLDHLQQDLIVYLKDLE